MQNTAWVKHGHLRNRTWFQINWCFSSESLKVYFISALLEVARKAKKLSQFAKVDLGQIFVILTIMHWRNLMFWRVLVDPTLSPDNRSSSNCLSCLEKGMTTSKVFLLVVNKKSIRPDIKRKTKMNSKITQAQKSAYKTDFSKTAITFLFDLPARRSNSAK